MNEINNIKSILNAKFSINDLGPLKYFLGIEIARSRKGILLYQRKYALDILQETGMITSKSCSTPMEYGKRLISLESGTPLTNPSIYRRLMSKLLYLAHTIPDISFSVGHLSQFLSKPTDKHFEGANRILRYIKGSISVGVFFPTYCDFKIKGYTDSDWAGCPDSRKFVSAYCFYLGNSLISWKSKKQHVVARSSAEAEYRTMALGACETQWLLYLLEDLQIPHLQPIIVYCDNQSVIHITVNLVFHERTKHIEVDYHSVRENIQTGLLYLLSIPTDSQIADLLTKVMSPHTFHHLFSKLGMLNIHIPACGGMLESKEEDPHAIQLHESNTKDKLE
ncbi:PREDICTED: uncharacterized protein LOC109356230 [Lupinus angustifolius]|uniref:uncharacterized protein LOC109356230 n=1 Tax=Lupinus angustifolius TaxID=3871 RepID=UPI00092FC0C9|nr:PREDICTED: uncharacterized protein LOC109356230 [Lupinus angustifolius]